MKFKPEVKRFSPPSALTQGWHPGYILRIVEEPPPPFFKLSTHSTALAWYVAVWQRQPDVLATEPELHMVYCSPTFNPGGGKTKDNKPISPSKAYTWVKHILQRSLREDEVVEIAELKPYPVRLLVDREEGKDYVRITDFAPWEEAPEDFPISIQILMQSPLPTKAVPSSSDDIPY